MSKIDPIYVKIKSIAEIEHETILIRTILNYARSGHATAAMVEQAIELTKKHIKIARDLSDEPLVKAAEKLKAGLEEALIDGIDSLRRQKPPNLETIHVEEPLARILIEMGHRIRRQMRCPAGIIDIYDLTANEIIECKVRGTNAALGEAAGQLQRYRKSFNKPSVAIAVLSIDEDAAWMAKVLRQQRIRIFEMSEHK